MTHAESNALRARVINTIAAALDLVAAAPPQEDGVDDALYDALTAALAMAYKLE